MTELYRKGREWLEKLGLWRFFTYVLVGGTAAVVEWVTFFVCDALPRLPTAASTAIAFLTATFVNWILGRTFTFRETKKSSDILPVFAVSAVGLFMNIGLMLLFVERLSFPSLPSKIGATGIVFFWNYFSRKYLIYKG